MCPDDDRLKKLGEQLDAYKQQQATEQHKRSSREQDAENMNMGFRAGAELITPIAVGAFIGWLLDGWLDTTPIFLIIFLLFGIGAGFLGVYRVTNNIGGSVGFAPLHKSEKKDTKPPENGA